VLIPIVYLNGKQDMVKGHLLSELIDQQQITRFKRSDGWVDLATGNIRSQFQIPGYDGPERRGLQRAELTG